MTNRTDVITRIMNLRELADKTGSQAEAENAMVVADKMMQAYRIEEAELAMAEAQGQVVVDIVSRRGGHGMLNVGRNRHKAQACLWSLAAYCEVKCVLSHKFNYNTGNYNQEYHLIGDHPDVELFEYLIKMIVSAMDRGYSNWTRQQQGVGRGAKASFQLAMSETINRRLSDMIRDRANERDEAVLAEAKLLNKDEGDVRAAMANGTILDLDPSMALVVVAAADQKREAVNEAYQSHYKNTKLGTASGFGYRSGNTAAQAGRKAGHGVNFGRPVGGSNTQRIAG